ncbi:MAG: DUF2333 family protein [Thermodesulfobacteriota bacterium]|nr:DUF2333 family protein [Thermodesulfobacteriota bacterium]
MNMQDTHNKDMEKKAFYTYALPRVAAVLVVAVGLIWGALFLADWFGSADPPPRKSSDTMAHEQAISLDSEQPVHNEAPPSLHDGRETVEVPVAQEKQDHAPVTHPPETATHEKPAAEKDHQADVVREEAQQHFQVTGEAFVAASIESMHYELEERFWGWRPNDLIRFTDNVNEFQKGVLEVTRRTTVKLAERISRTGSTAILDKNLERAMNWFMVQADSFWFPSAEQKYKDGLEQLQIYKERLATGEATFYTRTDNLIPLFKAYADLLGSCDENLVKLEEKNGKQVSTFMADNYFYYAKGVACSMLPVLEAVAQDFHDTLVTRGSAETLHHAIEACHHACSLDPLIVMEGDLDGFVANHRANMAAHISHARFYLDVLVNTLST